jgi:leucyl-tRNA synthetase
MFMGPLEMTKPWNTKGVEGVYRFLGRVWRLFVDEAAETEFEQRLTTNPDRGAEWLKDIKLHPAIQDAVPTRDQLKALHACIRKVTEDLDGLRFNTAISAMMVFVNEATAWTTRPRAIMRDFLILLQPFAPHIAEELFSNLHRSADSLSAASDIPLSYLPWPKHDPALLVKDMIEMPVQVNGKLRDKLTFPTNASQQEIEAAARASDKVQSFLAGKTIKKVIVVPGKLVNIVAT